jgi:hypothetical protein
MKFIGKTFGPLLASLALSSCGGGGSSSSGSTFTAPTNSTITVSATTTTLPVNTVGYQPTQYANPTQAEVTIVWRNPNGSLVSGQDVSVSISPTNVAALSCLVDGDQCKDGNALFGGYTIKGINGQTSTFVNAQTATGTATLVASGVDPNTKQTVSASLVFTVTSGGGTGPAAVALTPVPDTVYLPSSGGNNTSLISATVTDGAGQLIVDPVSGNAGVDNIQFEIVGNAGDARLTTNSVTGSVSGTTVMSHTVHGVATVSFQAGDQTPLGPVQIKATVDRSDNNVSNGIQNPVAFTTSVAVSDGKLDSLQITSPLFAPNLNGLTINCVVTPCVTPTTSSSALPSATALPDNPDGTLTLVVSATAKDRQGHPPLPGTTIKFGLVDAPVGAPGTALDNAFLISGRDGNPQEGGTAFTAPTGQFTTAGGGAGPGDALLVFGKEIQGNDDLESAVTVQRVVNATNLVVTPDFNLNNTTGVSVDYGAVLPYLVGRARQGNVTVSAQTDENGNAHAQITYPVNAIGNSVAIWAQGDGVDRVTSGARRITDAGILVYPGVAPATISASPDPLIGNTTTGVTVCVTDAIGVALRGQPVSFQFELNGGSGSIDGASNSGDFRTLTGIDGCATGSVVTTGVPTTAAGGNSGTLILGSAGAQTSVSIAVNIATLQVSPNSVSVPDNGSSGTLTVTAVGVDQRPITGAVVTGTCTAAGGSGAAITLTPTSTTTSNVGTAVFGFNAFGFVKPGTPASDGPPPVPATPPIGGTGQCVFSAPGANNAIVNFVGVPTSCSISPQPAGC